ncbi:MAG: hypothetical protein SGJ20_00195 [Planctomycetota bacterium]|nr:hypothetical protein [Planctomycetota bacterium]
MGISRPNGGYSATVEAYFVVEGDRIPLAKTNGSSFVVDAPCELAPGTRGDLLIIVDGNQSSSLVELPDGIALGQEQVRYEVIAPF